MIPTRLGARPAVECWSVFLHMRSARFIAVCVVACLIGGCALTVGFCAAIGCAMLYKRVFDSSPSVWLIFVLMMLVALPGMWAGLTAVKFHRLVRWAAG